MKNVKKYRYYLISFGFILIVFIINLLTQQTSISISRMNVFDTFLRFDIEKGEYTDIAVIIGAILPTFDDHSQINIVQSDPIFDRFISLYFPKALKVGMVFIVANIIALIICFIFSSKPAIYTGLGYGYLGTFGVIRRSSPIIYIMLYTINCSIFGLLISVFSQSISDITEKKHLILVVTLLYYYSYLFLPIRCNISSVITCLFPGFFYSFLEYDLSIGQRLLGFIIMIFVSFIIFCFSEFKSKQRKNREIVSINKKNDIE